MISWFWFCMIIFWLAVGFIWTEVMLRANENYREEQGLPPTDYRQRGVYLFVTVVMWPIPFFMWVSDTWKARREAKEDD